MTGAVTTVTRSKKRRCVEVQSSAEHTESSMQPNCSQTAGSVGSGHDERLELLPAPNKSFENPIQLEEKDYHVASCAPTGSVEDTMGSVLHLVNNPVGSCGASSSAGPARIMRCEPPIRSRRSASPAVSSSCLDLNETHLLARVTRCSLPVQSVTNASSPASCSSSQCGDFSESDSLPLARVARAGSSRSRTTRSTLANASESTHLQCSGTSPLNAAEEGKDGQLPSRLLQTNEVLPSRLPGAVADVENLKCRQGQSSYSLRALKTVPKYYDTQYSGFGIPVKPRAKSHSTKKDVNKPNCINGLDAPGIEFDTSPINSLPNEILCMVFSYLPQLELLRTCSRVCHRWRSIAMTPMLWQTLCIRGQDVPIEIVRGCIKQSSMLKSITIKDRQDIDAILPVLHQQSKRLESVNLIRCKPGDVAKRNLHAKYLYPFLRKGNLHNLNLKGTDYKSRKFYQMLSVLPTLEKLNISCSKSISPQILIEIAKQTNLKVFKNKWHSNSVFHGPKSMTIQLPGKIDDWSNAYSQVFHNAGKNLTTLEFYAAGISNAALLGLSSCKKLKKLFIYNANCFGNESMAAVCNLPELQELLIHNAKLKSTDVLDIFQNSNLSGLKCLHLNECIQTTSNDGVSADAFLKMVAEKCGQLRHFSFTNCSNVSDDGVQSVLRNCPKLESLDLNGATGVEGQSFLEIPHHNPQLKLLIVEENCSEQKNAILKTLTEKHGISVSRVSTWKHRCTPYLL